IKEKKSQCWLERLTWDYTAEYNATPYNHLGAKHIAGVQTIYNARLKTDANPWIIRCLPYFYVLGVTKCGTTDFVKALGRHPQVYWPWTTEVMYWNRVRYPEGVTVHESKEIHS
ncbi:hypothetical protein LSH36_442g03073, partial [Paralvinella palmiformis]